MCVALRLVLVGGERGGQLGGLEGGGLPLKSLKVSVFVRKDDVRRTVDSNLGEKMKGRVSKE